ncbi:MAG: EAL domain-containing protein [Proteobacteria bacterium]|nr:EAL domain-containing protein [Pseudomonadota bacterium]
MDRAVWKIALTYAIFAALWILLSDQMVLVITRDPQQIALISTFKGWLFVAVTSFLLALIVRRYLKQLASVNDHLRDSEERWKFALEGAGDGVWDWNIQTGAAQYSRRWKEILGHAENEIGDSSEEWIKRVHAEDLPRVMADLQAHIEGRTSSAAIEFRMRCKDGDWKWILGRGIVVSRDSSGKPIRVVGTNTDISHRKQVAQVLQDANDRYERIASTVPVVLYDDMRYPDNSSRLVFLSKRSSELFEIEADSPGASERIWAMVHPDDLHRVRAEAEKNHDAANTSEFRIVTPSGRLKWIQASSKPSFDAPGKPKIRSGFFQDITERKKYEEQLLLAEKVFANSDEAITVTDASGKILSVNQAFTKVTGYGAEEAIGQNPRMLKSDRHGKDFYREMWLRLNSSGQWQGEIWNRRKSGEIFPEWLSISVVKNSNNVVTNYVAIFADITERKTAQDQIEFLAFHDPLTKLPNRLLGKDRVRQAIAYSDREHAKSAILFLDLDNFKFVNDSLGHSVGDGLLVAVATRLQECVRDMDTLCRLAGDEFLVVLQDVRDSDAISLVCEKILKRLSESFHIDAKELTTSFSIGVAVYPDDGRDTESLLKNADTAMYQAKEAGRNTYRFFDDQMNLDAVEHFRLREGLRHALERGEFELYYQPQIAFAEGVVGAEALIRWNHPELGMLLPGRFISAAEDSGLIVPIGAWVLREACRQAVAWHAAGLPEIPVAVNLSAVQFRRGDLERTVAEALRESTLDPALLELELTESILIHDTESVLATVNRLKVLGVKFSIDDFGTGYSSLSYLKRFDVDKLKIDQSFIRDIASDPDDSAIVSAIIQMAKSLKLKTIAEGVETLGMLDYLRDLGCEEAQGYHFARPMPADDFVSYLASSRPGG